MASPGQTLENRPRRKPIPFRATAAQTDGALVAIDLELPPGRRVPGPRHVHPHQEERFEVVEGTMRFTMGRARILAGPGETVVVPAGVAHDFANAGDRHALVRVEVRPALQMERLFETAVALADEGRTMLGGVPKPLEPCALRPRVRRRGACGLPAVVAAAPRARAVGLARRPPWRYGSGVRPSGASPAGSLDDAAGVLADAYRHVTVKTGKGADHARQVARILAEAGCDERVQVAGLLHDVVEDTPRTVEDIRDRFGPAVAALVAAVTEDEPLG